MKQSSCAIKSASARTKISVHPRRRSISRTNARIPSTHRHTNHHTKFQHNSPSRSVSYVSQSPNTNFLDDSTSATSFRHVGQFQPPPGVPAHTIPPSLDLSRHVRLLPVYTSSQDFVKQYKESEDFQKQVRTKKSDLNVEEYETFKQKVLVQPEAGIPYEDPRPAVYVNTKECLEIIVDILRNDAGPIAIDLEFSNVNSFAPTLELMQLSTECGILAVIDFAMVCKHAKPLIELLNESSVILHGGDQDLCVLHNLETMFGFPCVPKLAQDTQILHAFTGLHYRVIGLGKLITQSLNIMIPKGLGASDWSQRPLSTQQIHYAFNDVRYLHLIRHHLQSQLESMPPIVGITPVSASNATASPPQWARWDFVQDELKAFTKLNRTRYGPDDAWRTILPYLPPDTTLSSSQFTVLKALCKWREIQAYRSNRNPTTIMRHEVLIHLVQFQPSEHEITSQFAHQPFVRANARTLSQLMAAAEKNLLKPIENSSNDQDDPSKISLQPSVNHGSYRPPQYRLEDALQSDLYSILSAAVSAIGRRNNIVPEKLASGNDLKELILFSHPHQQSDSAAPLLQPTSQSALRVMSGARRELCGDYLLAVARGEVPLTFHVNLEQNHVDLQ